MFCPSSASRPSEMPFFKMEGTKKGEQITNQNVTLSTHATHDGKGVPISPGKFKKFLLKVR
jgi:hypothetical protein